MTTNLNIFLIGVGNVGSAFINETKKNKAFFVDDRIFFIKVIAMASSSKTIFSSDGINLENWKLLLQKSPAKTNINEFISKMIRLNLPNSVFLDCTDGNSIIPYYKKILSSSIPIVTPNKNACSNKLSLYSTLNKISKHNNVRFHYSATVGVGIPSLDIIQSLLRGGDKVLSIEGLFSSTMNYVLNEIMYSGKKFSDIILEAQKLGMTEPDPRNDLTGLDSAKKILILAREAGANLELAEIKIQNLVTKKLQRAQTQSELINQLKQMDKYFSRLKKLTIATNKKLIYLASYKNNSASVKIVRVNSTHPFNNISANEKIISIKSKFYSKTPLIIKGRGGGVDVTARVLISDIIKTIKN